MNFQRICQRAPHCLTLSSFTMQQIAHSDDDMWSTAIGWLHAACSRKAGGQTLLSMIVLFYGVVPHMTAILVDINCHLEWSFISCLHLYTAAPVQCVIYDCMK